MVESIALMHRDLVVAILGRELGRWPFLSLEDLVNPAHLPLPLNVRYERAQEAGRSYDEILIDLNNWLRARAIPHTRINISKALRIFQADSPQDLIPRSYGLSLSDQYWLQPVDAGLCWEDVNFFHHSFSAYPGRVLLDYGSFSDKYSWNSPDIVTDGWLTKRWISLDGTLYLQKGGSGLYRQEPYNEVLASYIAKCLQVPHVPYDLYHERDQVYSICPKLIEDHEEIITADQLARLLPLGDRQLTKASYLDLAVQLGLDRDETEREVDQMLVVDYLILNSDRHKKNFGLVRDAKTLEYLRPAPLFDQGTSLYHDADDDEILARKAVDCKPFAPTHDGQLALVKDLAWLDLGALADLEDFWNDLVGQNLLISRQRRLALAGVLRDQKRKLVQKQEAATA